MLFGCNASENPSQAASTEQNAVLKVAPAMEPIPEVHNIESSYESYAKTRADQAEKDKKEYQDAVLNDPNSSASETAIVTAEKMREMGLLKNK